MCARSGAQVSLCARKVGRPEKNLSTPWCPLILTDKLKWGRKYKFCMEKRVRKLLLAYRIKYFFSFCFIKINSTSHNQGRIQRFWKEGALYVSHHGWPMKKILIFRWSKKAKITLETKVFGETFLSVFSNFLLFLYRMKPCRWNLISFPRFENVFIRK